MNRYIDADKLYELIRTNDYRLATKNGSIDYGMFTVGIKQAIDKMPTADVKEVKHGQWNTVLDESILEHYNNDVDIFACSICGIKSKRPTVFCPSCGARMDGGVKE